MELEKLKAYQQVLLSQVYSQKIQENEESIKTWTQYKDKHVKIIEGLQTLVHELTLNCMVPLGKRALMKGKLTHTNEILVCIGDGYFVKYSAQQAIELCNRRIKRSEEMLQNFEKERNLFEIRQMLPLDYGAFELGDCKEFIEHWDEKKIEDWRVEHRKREQEYRKKLIELKETEKIEIVTEDDLFNRLDQLELEEELADEFNRLDEEHKNFYGQSLQDDEEDAEYEQSEEEEEEEEEEVKEEEKEEVKEEEQEKNEKSENEKEKKDILKEEVASISNNENLSSIVQIDQNRQVKLSDITQTEQKEEVKETKEIIPKPVEKRVIPVMKDNKINGKFEVSIIKEDEVQKMLGKPSISLESCTSTHKTVTFETSRKKRRRIRTFSFEDSDSAEADVESRKTKSSGRRVSFAEPHFEVKPSSDQDNDSEVENTTNCSSEESVNINDDDDNIIQIEFKHSASQSFSLEGTENVISSPQDIHRIFCKPKSILKRPLDRCYPSNFATAAETLEEEEEPETNSIIEPDSAVRSIYNMVVQDIQERKPETTITESNNEPTSKKRPVSRFKLERTNLKNKISK